MNSGQSGPPTMNSDDITLFARTLAREIITGLPARSMGTDNGPLEPAARLVNSLFSELRFALGSADVVNGSAAQMLPFTVTEIDPGNHRGKIKYKRSHMSPYGATTLTIAFASGAPQIEDIPTVGADEQTIILRRPNAVAVTLWDNGFDDYDPPRPRGNPVLVSFTR